MPGFVCAQYFPVQAECVNTGTRARAQRLRRKIQNLLPEIEDVLVLDFAGVESASSSFLDELLGRLAVAMGMAAFRQKIRLVNMAPSYSAWPTSS